MKEEDKEIDSSINPAHPVNPAPPGPTHPSILTLPCTRCGVPFTVTYPTIYATCPNCNSKQYISW